MTILPKDVKLWMQEGPACLHFAWFPGHSGTVEMKKQNDICLNFILTIIKDNLFLYAYDENEMIEVSEKILAKEKEKEGYSLELIRKWEIVLKKYYDLCKKIDHVDLSSLPDIELKNIYKKFTDLYIEEYAVPLLTDPFGYFCGIETEKLLKKHLKKIGRENDYNKFLMILTNSSKDSFIGEEQLELLEITKKYSSGKDISKDLKKHTSRWYWIQNNYLRAVVLNENDFLERVKEHSKGNVEKEIEEHKLKLKKGMKEKNNLIKELEIPEDLQLIFRLTNLYTIWQDDRKKANLVAQHYLTLFLKEVSKRFKIDLDDLKFVIRDEVLDILDGKKLDINKIKLRQKIVGVIHTSDKSTLYEYKDSLLLDKEVKKQYDLNGIDDLYGMVANVGKIQGIVKVVKGPHEFDKLKQGDILVTSMTRPEFVPIMKKASAIVTDEGSITCHAAIVSRELGIPCIVGTKIATKVLKDGDLVEVNANHGVIRKLK